MAENSKIEWTDSTWNVITGCSVISPGCASCYAMKLAGTRLKHHPSRAGLTMDTKAGPVWNGKVRFNKEWLLQPLKWKRPRKIFVIAHGDLFHENVPNAWIDRVFAGMANSPQHTFQVLSKRADRQHSYLNDPSTRRRVEVASLSAEFGRYKGKDVSFRSWPLENVHIGTSVEDQRRADERLPWLRSTPATVRFISAEPLLEEITVDLDGIGWVICGGEKTSPDRVRQMPKAAPYSLLRQCRAAGVPFMMKQMTNKAPIPDDLMVREFPI